MKGLKKSHKESKRYLLLKGRDANENSIDQAILDFIGVLGYAEASPKILRSEKGLILAINRKLLDKVRASFVMSGKDIFIEKVSGSVKKLNN